MNFALIFLLLLFVPQSKEPAYTSPLAVYSAKWNNARYKVCNTAENARYMTESERQLIYLLNLARMNPKLFCESVVKKGSSISSFLDPESKQYFQTLVTTLDTLKPLNILYPDSLCYVSAHCHALTSGKRGYVGHDRLSPQCKRNRHFTGECCNYGSDNPLEILLVLLQDKGVPSLGHREICLGAYTKLGVSIQYHEKYGHDAVLDFY
jgi:uncharacterized protein YkwD